MKDSSSIRLAAAVAAISLGLASVAPAQGFGEHLKRRILNGSGSGSGNGPSGGGGGFSNPGNPNSNGGGSGSDSGRRFDRSGSGSGSGGSGPTFSGPSNNGGEGGDRSGGGSRFRDRGGNSGPVSSGNEGKPSPSSGGSRSSDENPGLSLLRKLATQGREQEQGSQGSRQVDNGEQPRENSGGTRDGRGRPPGTGSTNGSGSGKVTGPVVVDSGRDRDSGHGDPKGGTKGFGGLSVDDLRKRIGSIKFPDSRDSQGAGPSSSAPVGSRPGGDAVPGGAPSSSGKIVNVGGRPFTPVSTKAPGAPDSGNRGKEDWKDKSPTGLIMAAEEVRRRLGLNQPPSSRDGGIGTPAPSATAMPRAASGIPGSHEHDHAHDRAPGMGKPGERSRFEGVATGVGNGQGGSQPALVARPVEVRVSVATPRTTEYLMAAREMEPSPAGAPSQYKFHPGSSGGPTLHSSTQAIIGGGSGAGAGKAPGVGKSGVPVAQLHSHALPAGPGSGAADSYAITAASGGGYSAHAGNVSAAGLGAARGGIKIQPLDEKEKTALLEVPVYQDLNASFSNILFVVGSTQFSNESSVEQLNVIASVMRDEPGKKFLIEGHASDEGDEEPNLRLSVARAAAVEQHLLSRGVRPEQLVGLGYGEFDQEYPVAGYEPAFEKEQKRRLNRRVVVRLQAEE